MVDGRTAVLGLIGDPVAHTLSPLIHNALAEILGLNSVYAPFRVLRDSVGLAVKGAAALGFAGLNVTVPHKETVMAFLDETDALAEKVGAVNTITFAGGVIKGFNTDLDGVKGVFARHDVDVRGRETAVIGAGGGAYAAAFALADMGAAKVVVINRTLEKAERLAERVRNLTNADAAALELSRAGEVAPFAAVQATIVGLRKEGDADSADSANPVTDERFYRNLRFALDEIYAPPVTAFMKMAAGHGAAGVGAKVVNGFEMLVLQAARAYEIFMGTSVGKGDLTRLFNKASALLNV